MMIPQYIADRICRARPEGFSVLSNSTPVVSFGNALTAQVATLGLNPSRVEFQDKNGVMLTGAQRRLEDLCSLGTPGEGSVDPGDAAAVLDACNNYFHRQPYRLWFDQLELILEGLGASYYESTACHLDLVQWATDPVWGKLSRKVQEALVASDKDFLLQQLSNENIEILLLNGRGVINGFEGAAGLKLDEVSVTELGEATPLGKIGQFYTGRLLGKITVIGWSTNLQSSFGVSNGLRQYIRQVVAELAGRH